MLGGGLLFLIVIGAFNLFPETASGQVGICIKNLTCPKPKKPKRQPRDAGFRQFQRHSQQNRANARKRINAAAKRRRAQGKSRKKTAAIVPATPTTKKVNDQYQQQLRTRQLQVNSCISFERKSCSDTLQSCKANRGIVTAGCAVGGATAGGMIGGPLGAVGGAVGGFIGCANLLKGTCERALTTCRQRAIQTCNARYPKPKKP